MGMWSIELPEPAGQIKQISSNTPFQVTARLAMQAL